MSSFLRELCQYQRSRSFTKAMPGYFHDFTGWPGIRVRPLAAAEISSDGLIKQAAIQEEHGAGDQLGRTPGRVRAHTTGAFFRNKNMKGDCNLRWTRFRVCRRRLVELSGIEPSTRKVSTRICAVRRAQHE
jgi:hypothetical protein